MPPSVHCCHSHVWGTRHGCNRLTNRTLPNRHSTHFVESNLRTGEVQIALPDGRIHFVPHEDLLGADRYENNFDRTKGGKENQTFMT